VNVSAAILDFLTIAFVSAELFFGALIWLSDRRNPVNIGFGALALCGTLWGGSIFMLGHSHGAIDTWGIVSFSGPILLPVALLLFAANFPYRGGLVKNWHIILTACFAVFLLIADAMGYIVGTYHFANPIQYERRSGFYYLFAPYFIGAVLWGIIGLLQKYIRATSGGRAQSRYVMLGICLALITGCISGLVLPLLDITSFVMIGPVIAGAVFVAFAGYGVFRYQLMNVKLAALLAGAFLIIYSAVLSVPMVLGNYYSWPLGMILMFVFATTGPLLFRAVENRFMADILKERELR
jgi:hypothetical protein